LIWCHVDILYDHKYSLDSPQVLKFAINIANINHRDLSIDKPCRWKKIAAQNITVDDPAATLWINSNDDLSGRIFTKKAPINLPSATCDANIPIRKNNLPTRVYSCAV